jgi:hypothetical protein
MEISKTLRGALLATVLPFGLFSAGCGGGGGGSDTPQTASGFFSVSINGGTGGETTYYPSGIDTVMNGAYIPATDTMPGYTVVTLIVGFASANYTELNLDFTGSGTGTFDLTYGGQLGPNGLVYESGMFTSYIITPGVYDTEFFDWYGLKNPATDATGGTITISEYGPVGGKISGSYDVTLCDDDINGSSTCAQDELVHLTGNFSVTRGPDGSQSY